MLTACMLRQGRLVAYPVLGCKASLRHGWLGGFMAFGRTALLVGVLLIAPIASAAAQQEGRRASRQPESPAPERERAEPKQTERRAEGQAGRRAEGQPERRESPSVTPRAEPTPARSTGDPELKRRKR